MIPFKATYYQNKINEFKDKCKIKNDVTRGELYLEWELKIEKRLPGYMHNYKGNLFYTPHLYKNGELVMAVDGEEVGGLFEIIRKAHGRVGIVGLGLGYALQEILKKEKVTSVIVYEQDKNIIDLYYENFDQDPRVEIKLGDAFEADRESFDYFFVDIYNRKLSDKIHRDYIKFNEIHDINDYVFFGVDKFILSLFPQKFESKKIFKLWKDMANNTGERFRNSPYVENFAGFSSKKVQKLFDAFEF